MDTTNSITNLYNLNETDKETAATSVYTPKEYIFIKNREFFKKVKFQNISYLEASGSYCMIHLSNAEKIVCTHTLSEILRNFPSTTFIRVHRSFVVNMEHVNQYLGNQLWVEKNVIPIGRLFKKDVLRQLNILGADGLLG